MASFVYTYAKTKLLSGDLDLNAHDIRLMLVMTNTTADTEADKVFVGDFTTLDEMDGARGRDAQRAGRNPLPLCDQRRR